jgi:nucleoside-diphosphate-sugar epimerase
MASYLVTGGAGFIGSHLTEELVRRGHDVRVADSLVTGKRRNLDHIEGVEFLEGDLADLPFAQRAVAGMDYVLHQAAIPSVPRSVEYGNTPTLPKTEDMAPSPLSPYALQKVMGTAYCQMFTRLYGFETVVTRYFNVFGPRQDPGSAYSGVISLFSTALSEGRRPTIYGDGEQTRDFTYVANVVDGVLRACEAPKAAGEAINVACGTRISLNELLDVMNRIVGTDLEAIYEDERAGDVKDSQADISKAKALLGYEPIVDLEEGLRHTLAWCQGERTTAARR